MKPKFTIMIDPLSHYGMFGNDEKCKDVLWRHRVLIDWAMWYVPDPVATLYDHLAERYGYGMSPLPMAEITPSGMWKYPGDPNLYPFLWLTFEDGPDFLIYPYSLVAIRQSSVEPWQCTRME